MMVKTAQQGERFERRELHSSTFTYIHLPFRSSNIDTASFTWVRVALDFPERMETEEKRQMKYDIDNSRTMTDLINDVTVKQCFSPHNFLSVSRVPEV